MELKDKTIIVTGGGQGLGRAMAIEVAAAGANLALIDLNEEPLNDAVQLCKDAGGDARPYLGNVSKESEVEEIFDDIEKHNDKNELRFLPSPIPANVST